MDNLIQGAISNIQKTAGNLFQTGVNDVNSFVHNAAPVVNNIGKFIGSQPILNNPMPQLPQFKMPSPTIGETVPPLWQQPLRAAANLKQTPVLQNLLPGTNLPQNVQPQGWLGNAAFGNQPLTSLNKQVNTGVKVPFVGNVKGAAAIPLVAGGTALSLFPQFGGVEKKGMEEAINIAKNAGTADEFAGLLQKASPDAQKVVGKVLSDTKNPINTVEDFFSHAKGTPPLSPTAQIADRGVVKPPVAEAGLYDTTVKLNTAKTISPEGTQFHDVIRGGKNVGQLETQTGTFGKDDLLINYVETNKANRGQGIATDALRQVAKNSGAKTISAEPTNVIAYNALKKAFGNPIEISDNISNLTEKELLSRLPNEAKYINGGELDSSNRVFVRFNNTPRVVEPTIADTAPKGMVKLKLKPTTPVEQAVDAQLKSSVKPTLSEADANQIASNLGKPNPELVSSAKGIGEGKVPFQTNSTMGALNETKDLFSTGKGTTDVQNALRANRGQFDLSKDQLIRESAPLKQEWSKLTPEDNVKFIQDIQSGAPQANPRLQQLADQYRSRFDQDYQLAKELKPNLPYMENYFAQSGVWADTNAAKAFYQRFSLGGTPGAVQQRVFPTIQDGINAGLKLKETNPETIALNSRVQLLKAHMAQDFQEAQLAKGVPQEKIDAVLNKYLTPGIQGSRIYQTVRQGNAALNSLQLGFSGFHVAGTAINASVSKAGMAIKALTMGHPLDAMKNIIQTPTASLEYIFKGNQILKDVRAGNTTEDIANIAGGGGRLRTPDIYKGVGFQDALNNMRKDGWQNKLKGGLQTIPATIETAAKPIMEWWVPRLKAGAAADLISTNLKRLPAGASEEEINAVRSQAINSIDNRFGQLNMDNIFWNKTFKDLLALGTRSPGWNIGTIRELGGGVKDLGNLKQLFSGKGISDRSAYTLALPVVVGMLGATYQYVHTGQGPQEIKDFFYPKTGQTDPKSGNPERVSFPTYAKDVYSFMNNPVQTVANKLSPVVSIGSQVMQNKDYYGKSIIDPYANKLTQAKQVGGYIASAAAPFALTGGAKRVDPSLEARAENFMGVTKAPGTITNPGQQDYYNARAELQNLNSQFSTTTKKIANGDLTPQQGQSQLQDISSRIQNANTIVNKGLPTGAGAGPVTHNPAIVATPGGMYSYVDSKGIAHKNLTQVAAQQMQAKDTSGNKLSLSNGKSIDLTPPTQGTGIDAFTNQNWNITKARQVFQAVQAGLYTQQQAQAAYQRLGVTQQQTEYDYKASHSTDVKTQYITSQASTMTHAQLLQQLVSGRVVSSSGTQFASNAVLTNLYNSGLITKSEQNTLNNIKVNSQGNSLARVGTSGGGGGFASNSTGGLSRTKGLHPSFKPRAPRTTIFRKKRFKIAKSKRVKMQKIAKVQLKTSNTKSPNSISIPS